MSENRRSGMRFSKQEDAELIRLVGDSTVLYDWRDPQYRNNTKRDMEWEKIGRILNRTGMDCQKRWKSIRDHYKRNRREERELPEHAAKKKRAFYWDLLGFLDVEASNAESDLEPDESSLGFNEVNADTETQPKTVKSTTYSDFMMVNDNYEGFPGNAETLQREDNEIDMFFKTLAITLKKFRPDLAIRTKASIFRIVTEMEQLNRKCAFSDLSRVKNCSKTGAFGSLRKKAFQTGQNEPEAEVKIEIDEGNLDEISELEACAASAKSEPIMEEDQPMHDLETAAGCDTTRDAQEDASIYFGKYIAAELRTLPITTRLVVQQEIQNCITTAVFRNLTSSNAPASTAVRNTSGGPSNS
ncbi:uncharacterized protein LOC123315262 [Coccinella septempunctata]|uniref:uncharacterized protein LOC123315262 n=1 Tax=Coccinella septempunctata TaxID=41139 RepID=UPI001D09323C|nr:uncharacterized protein LOC123315262 [Coccinella septempunctata]